MDSNLISGSSHSFGEEELNAPVISYWERGRGWMWEKISLALPTLVRMKLVETSINPDSLVDDQVGWLD